MTNIPKLLRYEDKNSMYHSIETRLPYLDFNVVETLLSVSEDMKLRDGFLKFFLRQVAEKHLPHHVAWRTNKFGFEAPRQTLLQEQQQAMRNSISQSKLLDAVFEDKATQIAHLEPWRAYSLSLWEKEFSVTNLV